MEPPKNDLAVSQSSWQMSTPIMAHVGSNQSWPNLNSGAWGMYNYHDTSTSYDGNGKANVSLIDYLNSDTMISPPRPHNRPGASSDTSYFFDGSVSNPDLGQLVQTNVPPTNTPLAANFPPSTNPTSVSNPALGQLVPTNVPPTVNNTNTPLAANFPPSTNSTSDPGVTLGQPTLHLPTGDETNTLPLVAATISGREHSGELKDHITKDADQQSAQNVPPPAENSNSLPGENERPNRSVRTRKPTTKQMPTLWRDAAHAYLLQDLEDEEWVTCVERWLEFERHEEDVAGMSSVSSIWPSITDDLLSGPSIAWAARHARSCFRSGWATEITMRFRKSRTTLNLQMIGLLGGTLFNQNGDRILPLVSRLRFRREKRRTILSPSGRAVLRVL